MPVRQVVGIRFHRFHSFGTHFAVKYIHSNSLKSRTVEELIRTWNEIKVVGISEKREKRMGLL